MPDSDGTSSNEGEKVEKSDVSVSEAGRKGGQSTLRNRGSDHFREIGRKGGKRTAELYRDLLSEFGKRGGRPRRPSLNEAMEEGHR